MEHHEGEPAVNLDRPDPRHESPPRRYKRPDELTVEEHLRHMANGALPETDEYRAYRTTVLERAGLADDPAPAPDSVEAHLARITRYPKENHDR
jgi:hypothetical protein